MPELDLKWHVDAPCLAPASSWRAAIEPGDKRRWMLSRAKPATLLSNCLSWTLAISARSERPRDFLEKHPALDVLVNNAAVGLPERQESPDGIELTFATNVLGYFLVTNLLLDALRRAPAARIINVASKLASGLDLHDVEFKRRCFDATAAYAQSKQANRMLTWALVRRLQGSSVTANAMSPGSVNTRLLRTFAPNMKGQTTSEGADTIIWLAISPAVAGLTNRFWSDRTEQPCQFHNPVEEDALWSLCEAMTASSQL
jgi:retinol dehydrogenase-12